MWVCGRKWPIIGRKVPQKFRSAPNSSQNFFYRPTPKIGEKIPKKLPPPKKKKKKKRPFFFWGGGGGVEFKNVVFNRYVSTCWKKNNGIFEKIWGLFFSKTFFGLKSSRNAWKWFLTPALGPKDNWDLILDHFWQIKILIFFLLLDIFWILRGKLFIRCLFPNEPDGSFSDRFLPVLWTLCFHQNQNLAILGVMIFALK